MYSTSISQSDIVKDEIDDESLMRVTILNSHGEWLSGTLLGLREHFTGLLCLYGIAIALLLYLIRVSSCCTSQPAPSLTSYSLGSQFEFAYGQGTRLLSEEQKSSTLCPKAFCPPCSVDCGAARYSRGSSTHFDSQTRRLQLLTLLVAVQFISISFARHELSRFANSTDATYLTHPVAGADGPYSHIAELCSLVCHYILLGLLIAVSLSTIHDPSIHTPRCDSLPGCGTESPKCPIPAISTFKCLPFVSPHRLNCLLFATQVAWYLLREGLYWQSTYAPPELWPFEEKHAFWAGWGLPNNNYLTSTPASAGIPSRSSSPIFSGFRIAWHLFTVYSPVSVLLLLARSILGLTLAASLWHASRVGRTARVRSMQYRFAMVGFAWFLSYPFVGICAFLLAEHIRYKLTVVGITLIQTGCLGLLLAFVSRQTLFWDISSLGSSLPPLKCSPTSIR